jgi:hypothetical protein
MPLVSSPDHDGEVRARSGSRPTRSIHTPSSLRCHYSRSGFVKKPTFLDSPLLSSNLRTQGNTPILRSGNARPQLSPLGCAFERGARRARGDGAVEEVFSVAECLVRRGFQLARDNGVVRDAGVSQQRKTREEGRVLRTLLGGMGRSTASALGLCRGDTAALSCCRRRRRRCRCLVHVKMNGR